MLSHTTKLAGRRTRDIQLTADEARVMYEKGFRFSIYEPELGQFRLSLPHEMLIVPQRDELTISQL